VAVTLASPEGLVVPVTALQNSQSGQYVYVVTAETTAEMRPVVVERSNENNAVIAKGLSEGETIIIDGHLRVTPGRPVDIKDPAAAGAGRSPKSGKGDGKGKGKSKEKPSS
jgi:multidrug efflux system membrane fusion protein